MVNYDELIHFNKTNNPTSKHNNLEFSNKTILKHMSILKLFGKEIIKVYSLILLIDNIVEIIIIITDKKINQK